MGAKEAWTNVVGVTQSMVCSYSPGGVGGGALNPVGNAYNPGQPIQPITQYSYGPTFSEFPFSAFLDFKIKL